MPKSRKRQTARRPSPPQLPVWTEDDGVHAILPGQQPSTEELEALSLRYQEQVRHSLIWDRMVEEFGPEEAERILLKFKAEVRP